MSGLQQMMSRAVAFPGEAQAKKQREAWRAKQVKNVRVALDSLSPQHRTSLQLCIEEHVGQVTELPHQFGNLILSRHLMRNDRFKLTLFLLANAVPPAKMVEWLLTRGSLRDESARFHIGAMIKDHAQGTLVDREGQPWKTYVHRPMIDETGRQLTGRGVWEVPVLTPNFAISHPEFWYDGLKMLGLQWKISVPPPARAASAKAVDFNFLLSPHSDDVIFNALSELPLYYNSHLA